MVLPFVTAGLGIAQSVIGFANASAQTNAANKAAIEQYKYQLKIRDKKNADQNNIWATKLLNYDQSMKAADRAASRAYGAEMYNRNARLKAAAFKGMQLNRAFNRQAGSAAAAGKTGRSAARLDNSIEAAFVRNQNVLAANLLQGEEARMMREQGINDRVQGEYNRLYSNVAIAPTQPMAPMAPQMRAGPNPMGLALGIGSSIVGGFQQAANLRAPDPGNIVPPGSYNLPTTQITGFNSPSLFTSGMNFFGT